MDDVIVAVSRPPPSTRAASKQLPRSRIDSRTPTPPWLLALNSLQRVFVVTVVLK